MVTALLKIDLAMDGFMIHTNILRISKTGKETSEFSSPVLLIKQVLHSTPQNNRSLFDGILVYSTSIHDITELPDSSFIVQTSSHILRI